MHILLVLITAWICLNKPEKDLVVMHISNVFRVMWEICKWRMNLLILLSV